MIVDRDLTRYNIYNNMYNRRKRTSGQCKVDGCGVKHLHESKATNAKIRSAVLSDKLDYQRLSVISSVHHFEWNVGEVES